MHYSRHQCRQTYVRMNVSNVCLICNKYRESLLESLAVRFSSFRSNTSAKNIIFTRLNGLWN